MESVADLFFLNKNYASTLFKAKSGVKFIDYLTHIRVEKAKELLSNSTLKIPQIAVNVGYVIQNTSIGYLKSSLDILPRNIALSPNCFFLLLSLRPSELHPVKKTVK